MPWHRTASGLSVSSRRGAAAGATSKGFARDAKAVKASWGAHCAWDGRVLVVSATVFVGNMGCVKRARKDGLKAVSVIRWSKSTECCWIRYLDKLAQDIASEHAFCVTPNLERVVTVCSQALGQISHAFCLVILRELSRAKRNHGVGERMIKI